MDNAHEGFQVLIGNMKKILHIQEVKKIISPQHKTKAIDLQTIIMKPEDSCNREPDCVTLPDGRSFKKTGIYPTSSMESKNLTFGQMVTFSLTNNSTNTYYCHLIDISPNGKIEVIYPLIGHNSNMTMVKAGESLDISTEVGVLLNCTGEETIKLFATKEPFNVSLLEQSAYKNKNTTHHPGSYETIYASDTHATPKGIVNSFECNDWEIEQYSFYVK
ncbi:MAG: DUF4384 domain-containing protein [Candidatus Kuenenia sp.]|nr:DUF4384 domain-containing protein [Candidatus Kuenenia hertensis]